MLTGANIVGTVQQAGWLKYTFRKASTDPSKPRNIEAKAAKAGGMAKYTWKSGNVKITISNGFYRSGPVNAVALIMSTLYHPPFWNVILANKKYFK